MMKHAPALEMTAQLQAKAKKHQLEVCFPEQWSQQNPLTIWEIVESKSAFTKLGVKLKLARSSTPN